MSILTWGGITYMGAGNASTENWFRDQYSPVLAKNEWGVDVLTREVRGPTPFYPNFISKLKQGDVYLFNGTQFFLQSWQDVAHPHFPGARLVYKGLTNGIPDPLIEVSTRQASSSLERSGLSITLDFGTSGTPAEAEISRATKQLFYYSPVCVTRYISNQKPTAAKYTSTNGNCQIYSSKISVGGIYKTNGLLTDGQEVNKDYIGSAPVSLVSAFSASTKSETTFSAFQIVGTPYWECTDTTSLVFRD